MKDVLPALVFLLVVKPILAQHWQDVVIHNLLHPFIGAAQLITPAEIAVANTESPAQRPIQRNLRVQLNHLGEKIVEGFILSDCWY